MAGAPQPIVALDFDGVLCDSARETALSAWRAGRLLWSDWTTVVPPDPYLERFLHVRPWLETGYQAIVMMRMIADGLPDAEFAERLDVHCRRILADLGLGRDDLVRRFGSVRDEWIRHDADGWLAAHDFYPGVVAALLAAQPWADLYVLTTKQERFARALLESRGVVLAADRLFGLDRARPKEAILSALVGGGGEARPVHFVEDRVETLRRVLAEPALRSLRLYYAAWGYGTPGDLAWARGEPRVRVWELDQFLHLE